MINVDIRNKILNKYIEPTKAKRNKVVGVEIEMPIVNLDGNAVDEAVCQSMVKEFIDKFNFETVGIDDEGYIYSLTDEVSGDNLSFDCSYSNLELSMGKGNDLFELKERFQNYYTFINDYFAQYNYTLTGMGVNPNYNVNHNNPIQSERYRMLFHFLHSYKNYNDYELKFSDRADFGTFTSASQVQIDVDYEDLIDTINVFGRLEPYKSLLFANSYMEEYRDCTMVRNMLWEHSMHGVNKHNIGFFEEQLSSVEDLVTYISTTSIYCVMRDGKYINFAPIPIRDYFNKEKIIGEWNVNGNYEKVEFVPEEADIEYLRTFKFEDLTFRGTIEFRSTCCQPIGDSMTVAAFHLGLINNLPKIKKLLNEDKVIYSSGYTTEELQKMFSKRNLPEFVDKNALRDMLISILNISKEGLSERGMQEEILLKPLYERARKLTNPAKEMIAGIENGQSIWDYVQMYASL